LKGDSILLGTKALIHLIIDRFFRAVIIIIIGKKKVSIDHEASYDLARQG